MIMSYSMLIIFGSLFQTGPWPINPEVSSSEVTADASSNKSFKCMIDVDPDYCADVLELQWRFNDSSAPIKSGKKYKIQERNTNSKCEKELPLLLMTSLWRTREIIPVNQFATKKPHSLYFS